MQKTMTNVNTLNVGFITVTVTVTVTAKNVYTFVQELSKPHANSY